MVVEQQFRKLMYSQDEDFKVVPLIDIEGNQSIQLVLNCGCFQVEHILAQEKPINGERASPKDTLSYYEFCPKHLSTIQSN